MPGVVGMHGIGVGPSPPSPPQLPHGDWANDTPQHVRKYGATPWHKLEFSWPTTPQFRAALLAASLVAPALDVRHHPVASSTPGCCRLPIGRLLLTRDRRIDTVLRRSSSLASTLAAPCARLQEAHGNSGKSWEILGNPGKS